MSDTIDWSKPLQVKDDGMWHDVKALMRREQDGSPNIDADGELLVFIDNHGVLYRKLVDFRNKPETREPPDGWDILYPGGPPTVIRMRKVQDDE